MEKKTEMFRAYDLRGIVGVDLSDEAYHLLGKAYGTFLHKRKITTSTLGYDNRLNSESFSKNFEKGLTETGINVYNIGLVTTPLMYFSQYQLLSKGGAMITASHNPKEFNGLKLAVGFSDTMIQDEINELKEYYLNENFTKPEWEGTVQHIDVWEDYKKYVAKNFAHKFEYKIVVDTGNSTPGKFVPDLLRSFGVDVVEQLTELDGNFPNGTADPTETHMLSRLAERVKQEGANLGMAFDGDGDRIGVVDSKGNLIWNDILVAIFAKDVLDTYPGAKIVFNTLCSKIVDETIREYKGEPVMWMTGHSFIKSKIKEERAMFGGELSGHLFFMDNFFGHDDAFYSALRLLDYLRRHETTLDEEFEKLNKYKSSPEIKFGAPDDLKFEIVSNQITSKIKELYPSATINSIEGIRADWETGMINFRASNNGPYITLKFESSNDEEFESIKNNIKSIIDSLENKDLSYGVSLDFLGIK